MPGTLQEERLDALSLLRLQVEWGADEALEPAPLDRLHRPAAEPARPSASPAASAATSPPAAAVATLPPPAAAAPRQAARGQAAEARALAMGCADIASLRAAIAGFDGCSLRDTATHLVFAEGDANSGLVIVGEVPDAEEDRAGHPFAGQPGVLLDRMLESVGLDRTRLLLVPLIPWRPPGNRPPTELELATCLPFLERLLELARPARLLLMGSRPVKLLAGGNIRAKAGWQAVRLPGAKAGAEADATTLPALAMRHPSYLLSHPAAKRDAWASLLLLRRTLDEDAVDRPTPRPESITES